MLDSMLRDEAAFWDSFYENREKEIPFFVNVPDENLVEYFERGLIKPGKVLELGGGPGRNSIYFAEQGCEVDAVDLSETAINWAKERAIEKKVDIRFTKGSLYDFEFEEDSYDIIYDSGCFHHIPPHRRMTFLNLIEKALKPEGKFVITCFAAGDMGAEISDWEVYRQRSMKGGLGYTDDQLKQIFSNLELIEMRKMKEVKQPADTFGVPFLWTGLFKKRGVK
ncbi:class I SAM-dependent methyltransferase [Pseudalkalibacillus berkeleyi]|uniref:Class I SAM-dependent methyltransferase n=1 Tax=Pseudalkalibacillus berkeleyi TaxID=1069813 RepID=A0ABS9GUR4_9BACL|nr:class I SAM-dependent methyltransferase [Pseudalkalibacillus berkeleyi]MCF6136579.1 class I SAM-dependent methyltransferase [Pseudalkalibacillus berkeleyi]